MEINLKNIEEQILFDENIQKLLPEFRGLFEQWKVSIQFPGLGTLGKRTLLEFLNKLDGKHIKILEEYFGTDVFINKINHEIVKNYEEDLENLQLCEFSAYKEFSIYRKDGKIKMTFWR